MKNWLLIGLLGCSIEGQLDMIRPGASYIIHSGDYKGIEWTDKTQTKPTPEEMDQALLDCQEALKPQADPVKEQATTTLKSNTASTDQKVDALIKYLGIQ